MIHQNKLQGTQNKIEMDKAVDLSGVRPSIIADIAGPRPFPKSSVKLYKENIADLLLGTLTLIKTARTFAPVIEIRNPVKKFKSMKGSPE